MTGPLANMMGAMFHALAQNMALTGGPCAKEPYRRFTSRSALTGNSSPRDSDDAVLAIGPFTRQSTRELSIRSASPTGDEPGDARSANDAPDEVGGGDDDLAEFEETMTRSRQGVAATKIDRFSESWLSLPFFIQKNQ